MIAIKLNLIIIYLLLLKVFSKINCFEHKKDINENIYYDIFTCCSEVFGSCRASCENLSLVQLATDPNGKESKLIELRRLCPSVQVEFWSCMNRTLYAVAKGSQWSGRLCCPLALSPRCQNACATSQSKLELTNGGCRQSDEQTLYHCFERQEYGDECCGNARTSECLHACRDIFQKQHSPTKKQRTLLEHTCTDNNTNTKVLQCAQSFTQLTPITNSKQYLPCCDFSNNETCRSSCKHILNSGDEITQDEIIDYIDRGGCGPPLPHDPVWQCFMSAERKIFIPIHQQANAADQSQINQIGMDSAKLHCCYKAYAPKCRRLCIQTYSNDWTETMGDFEIDCLIGQNTEIGLRQCLDEVDEPCVLGCDGLGFCTNFNNRPTELFRSCNKHADDAAKADVSLWQEKRVLMLPGLKLPIKDISQCSPDTWRAIACALQIKPCTRIRHITQICREDCYDILSECIDWTRLQTGHTAASICSKLSLDDATVPCISLKPYLEPSDLPHTGNHEVTSPCNGHPCNATQVCLIDNNNINNNNNGGRMGKGYTCTVGCTLGETSPYMVAFGAYVRIPVSTKQKGCLKICRCGATGKIEQCQPLPCFSYDSCTLASRKIEHASWFNIECNVCSCYAGEITCTKKQCRIGGISDKSYTSLPCNCPPHHVPVCGKNGITYPSTCVAKCAGLQDADIEFGACKSKRPCENVNCPSDGKCIENRQICLSIMHRPCQQYQCVNTTTNCQLQSSLVPMDRVCGNDGRTYPSICHLVKSKQMTTMNYRGPCLMACNNQNLVCGINGQTYKSECDAWSDYSLVDYAGECRQIGLLTDTMGPRCSSSIKCKRISTNCQPIYPPGACCPICSAAIRIVYSKKQIDRAMYALKQKNMDFITLRAILHSLEQLLRLGQCRLAGYLTIETDLFVTVQSNELQPNRIQIEACSREIERISILISTQSHQITSDLALSALTVANIVDVSSSSSSSWRNNGGNYARFYLPVYYKCFLLLFCLPIVHSFYSGVLWV